MIMYITFPALGFIIGWVVDARNTLPPQTNRILTAICGAAGASIGTFVLYLLAGDTIWDYVLSYIIALLGGVIAVFLRMRYAVNRLTSNITDSLAQMMSPEWERRAAENEVRDIAAQLTLDELREWYERIHGKQGLEVLRSACQDAAWYEKVADVFSPKFGHAVAREHKIIVGVANSLAERRDSPTS